MTDYWVCDYCGVGSCDLCGSYNYGDKHTCPTTEIIMQDVDYTDPVKVLQAEIERLKLVINESADIHRGCIYNHGPEGNETGAQAKAWIKKQKV